MILALLIKMLEFQESGDCWGSYTSKEGTEDGNPRVSEHAGHCLSGGFKSTARSGERSPSEIKMRSEEWVSGKRKREGNALKNLFQTLIIPFTTN